MFKICPDCDFEWHHKDGERCPACSKAKLIEDDIKFIPSQGGAFGTGRHSVQMKKIYAGIGIVALVLIIYAFIIG